SSVGNPVDLRHPRADGGAEHYEVKRRGDGRGRQSLPQRAHSTGDLKLIDSPDPIGVKATETAAHGRALTRLTKISSSELWCVLRSRKPMPSSPKRLSSVGIWLSCSCGS